MKFKKSKYFLLLKTDSPSILKFKQKNEKFFSFQIFSKLKLLPLLIYDVLIENNFFPAVNPENVYIPFKILGITKLYNVGSEISFKILNIKNEDFSLQIIITDFNNYVRFERKYYFNKEETLKEDKFKISTEGDYKIKFFCNNKFVFYKEIKIVNEKDVLYFNLIQKKDSKLYFQLKFLDNIEKEDLKTEIYSTLTGARIYWTVADNVKIKDEILYVPLKKFFPEIDKVNLLSKFAVEDDFNPAGVLKLFSTISELNELNEIKFIKELFENSFELAFKLTKMVNDFEIIFKISPQELREILSQIDILTIATAFKTLNKEKIGYIKYHISEKKFNEIETKMNEITIVSDEEIKKAKDSISDYVGEYLKKKYGLKIVVNKKEERFKIQDIWEKIKFNKDKNLYFCDLKNLDFSGNFIVYFYSPDKRYSKIIFKNNSGKKQFLFYENIIYKNKNFYQIIGVDSNFIYIKFDCHFSIIQIILLDKNNYIISIFETKNVFNDEIIKFQYSSVNEIRILIAGVEKDTDEIYETDSWLEIFPEEEKEFDSFFIKRDLKLNYSNLYYDFVLIQNFKSKNIEIFKEEKNVKTENIIMFSKNLNEVSEKIILSFPVVFASLIKFNNENIIRICNPLKKEIKYKIEIDSPYNIETKNINNEIFNIYPIRFKDYLKIEIKSQFGDFALLKEKDLYSINTASLDINQIKNWLFNETEYNIFHIILLMKISFYEGDLQLFKILFDSIQMNYFNGKNFRESKISNYKTETTISVLNRLAIFYQLNDAFKIFIEKILKLLKDQKIKDFNLWIYGKKYAKDFSKFKKYIYNKLKNWNYLNETEKLNVYHALYFLNKKKLKNLELKNFEILKVDYLEILDKFIDIIIIKKFLIK